MKKETSPKIEKTVTAMQEADTTIETRSSGIVVNDHMVKPKTLPLVIVLPEGANKAQKDFARILNAYAYMYPKKWKEKKEDLLKELEAKANEPDAVEDPDKSLYVGPKPIKELPV